MGRIKVRATHDYLKPRDDAKELKYQKGDELFIIKQDKSGWWKTTDRKWVWGEYFEVLYTEPDVVAELARTASTAALRRPLASQAFEGRSKSMFGINKRSSIPATFFSNPHFDLTDIPLTPPPEETNSSSMTTTSTPPPALISKKLSQRTDSRSSARKMKRQFSKSDTSISVSTPIKEDDPVASQSKEIAASTPLKHSSKIISPRSDKKSLLLSNGDTKSPLKNGKETSSSAKQLSNNANMNSSSSKKILRSSSSLLKKDSNSSKKSASSKQNVDKKDKKENNDKDKKEKNDKDKTEKSDKDKKEKSDKDKKEKSDKDKKEKNSKDKTEKNDKDKKEKNDKDKTEKNDQKSDKKLRGTEKDRKTKKDKKDRKEKKEKKDRKEKKEKKDKKDKKTKHPPDSSNSGAIPVNLPKPTLKSSHADLRINKSEPPSVSKLRSVPKRDSKKFLSSTESIEEGASEMHSQLGQVELTNRRKKSEQSREQVNNELPNARLSTEPDPLLQPKQILHSGAIPVTISDKVPRLPLYSGSPMDSSEIGASGTPPSESKESKKHKKKRISKRASSKATEGPSLPPSNKTSPRAAETDFELVSYCKEQWLRQMLLLGQMHQHQNERERRLYIYIEELRECVRTRQKTIEKLVLELSSEREQNQILRKSHQRTHSHKSLFGSPSKKQEQNESAEKIRELESEIQSYKKTLYELSNSIFHADYDDINKLEQELREAHKLFGEEKHRELKEKQRLFEQIENLQRQNERLVQRVLASRGGSKPDIFLERVNPSVLANSSPALPETETERETEQENEGRDQNSYQGRRAAFASREELVDSAFLPLDEPSHPFVSYAALPIGASSSKKEPLPASGASHPSLLAQQQETVAPEMQLQMDLEQHDQELQQKQNQRSPRLPHIPQLQIPPKAEDSHSQQNHQEHVSEILGQKEDQTNQHENQNQNQNQTQPQSNQTQEENKENPSQEQQQSEQNGLATETQNGSAAAGGSFLAIHSQDEVVLAFRLERERRKKLQRAMTQLKSEMQILKTNLSQLI